MLLIFGQWLHCLPVAGEVYTTLVGTAKKQFSNDITGMQCVFKNGKMQMQLKYFYLPKFLLRSLSLFEILRYF